MCTLLNLGITEGAHIAETREVKKKWNAVNDAFFNQNELLEYKATLYKKDDPRKIRDKYDKMLKEIKADIESGNQSGKSGEIVAQHLLSYECQLVVVLINLYKYVVERLILECMVSEIYISYRDTQNMCGAK